MTNKMNFSAALDDFYKARRKAQLQDIVAALRGESTRLLSYEEVRKRLQAVESSHPRLEDIPLDSIVGSVGRYNDFTRSFLPKHNSDKQRWVNVELQMTGLQGLPPIDVYQLGSAYFVKDGNHRVSVARQLGFNTIQAYVTRVHSRVPLDASVQPEDIIIKEEYLNFLELTQLDQTQPAVNRDTFSVTVAGGYQELLEHIQAHQYFMSLERARTQGHLAHDDYTTTTASELPDSAQVSLVEAASDWYESIFEPALGLIQTHLLAHFPGRSKADMYLWLSRHQQALEDDLGWQLPQDAAARDLLSTFADRHSDGVGNRPAFADLHAPRSRDRLIQRIMVPLSGSDVSWNAFEQALVIAAREHATIYGLHIQAASTSPQASDLLEQEFYDRCQAAAQRGQFATQPGQVVASICQRSRHMDIVIATLPSAPPMGSAILSDSLQQEELSSSAALLRCCKVPLLAMRGEPYHIKRALVAYDGSPQADSALYAATYLAARWQVKLMVMTVLEFGQAKQQALAKAKDYLAQHEVEASFLQTRGRVADGILQAAAVHESDLILLGSYRYNALVEPLLGGVLDQLLKNSQTPLLVCK
jgi:nucleotide-binding universal stress UspA family protein